MHRSRLLLTVILLLGGLACGAARQPKLVLVISVDQFRYDYLLRFRSQYNAGIARLLERGAVFTNAYLEHFPTVTAVGHATILTGATPSLSGIVGNAWFDRELGRQVTSVSDDTVPLLGAPGKSGSSPRKLLVSTVGDELKATRGLESKVIGISLKDRAAILSVGRMADGAFWYDNRTGNFVSSGYYYEELPEWVNEFNASREVDAFAGAEWKALDAASDEPLLTLPAAAGPRYYGALRTSPFGNDIVEMMAERAIQGERLGKGDRTDLLCLSFSSNDHVGHRFGPDSPQVRDISIRTDRLLEKLFRFIDREIGMDKVLVVMTADHGVAPMPEVMHERRLPGGRITERAVLKAVEARLTELHGEGKWMLGNSGPAPYLNYDLIREKGLTLAEVRREAAEAVRDTPHILRVYTYDQLAEGRVLGDHIDRLVGNGFHPKRASDLFIVVEPYWLFQKDGTSHGSPHNYDTHLPIIFMGQGVKAGRYHRRAAINDIAPTLAALLEVEVPSGSTGRVLVEMLDSN